MPISTHLEAKNAPSGRHSDAKTKGLYLIVSNDGKNRRWAYRFTKPSTGRVSELGLGGLDVLSLQDAREAAEAHRKALKRDKTDPVEAKREAKAERARAQCSTFGVLAENWLDEKAGGFSASHTRKVRHLLTIHAGVLTHRPITGITSDDVVSALRPLREHAPEQERRALAAVSRVFEYAMARDLCDKNPADWRGRMNARYPKRNGQRGHYTAMLYAQIPAFVAALHAAQARDRALSPWGIEFLLLTVCRVGEVANMKWDEIEGDVWAIPAQRMKTGKEHRVPLSSRAMDILALQPKDGEFVWLGRKEGEPLFDRSLYQFLILNMGLKGKATLHGFRSSFRDWGGDETDYARENIEECLAHAVGNEVERAYRRETALAKRRVIMQAWSDFCGGEQEREAEPRAVV
ncbi:Site-specific recombinase XerD [Rhizobiales bacterium GAS191]|nr:Site-specific recombinase XerD [Rhizobiales bacterium GAS191]